MTLIDLKDMKRHPASFRDPAGTVFNVNGRIVRGLSVLGAQQYQDARNAGLLDALEHTNKIIKTTDIDVANGDERFVRFVEHAKVPFISYPYEWSFLLLKEAALHHLNIQLEALAAHFVLTDASAYNIQFQGVSPVFIDILSFKKYQEGEVWKGHRQFCEQFLSPLLLFAIRGVAYNAWYRGAMEGIPIEAIARLLPLRSWLSLRMLLHILLPSKYHSTKKDTLKNIEKIRKTSISQAAYRTTLNHLYRWINDLKPPKNSQTLWESYDVNHTYTEQELSAKKRFIAEFSAVNKPGLLWDLGCNNGEYSELALANCAGYVVGFDEDVGALNQAVLRAQRGNLNFLPLYQEITNPSPAQGWLCMERDTLASRGSPDAIIALAFIHHLIIGHNITMLEAMNWLVGLAPVGVVEFVQKSDPTVQMMLTLKGDIFPDYSEETFVALLQQRAVIIKSEVISNTGRCLYWYKVIS